MRMFEADKISGAEASNFAMSAVLGVFEKYQETARFKYPFYGLTVDTATGRMTEWIRRDQYAEVTQHILDTVQREGLGYFSTIRKDSVGAVGSFLDHVREFTPTLSQLTDDELLDAYDHASEEYCTKYALGLVTFLYEEIISERLSAALSARYTDATERISSLLSTRYKSFIVESEEALQQVQKATDNERQKYIDAYIRDFFYMRATYLRCEHITPEMVVEMASHTESHPQKDIGGIETELTDEERAIVDVLRETEIIRDLRKKLATIGNYMMFEFVREAVRRTKLSQDIVTRIFWNEYAKLMRDPTSMAEVLQKRIITSAVLEADRTYYLEYNAFVDRAASEADTGEVRGTPASGGTVRGRACVILGTSDFGKFQRGDILIAEMTRPEFVPVMRLASAFVTDEGGLTCHAAVIAREMRKPCIVGTRRGTSTFKDGDLVEVDANRGIVRIAKG
ncbi:MAG TPA: PEP-utilizing enzyme [Candidatus Paceibacterota bacterium]